MLTITAPQLAALDRAHFMTKLHAFLAEHATAPAVRALLADAQACFDFWRAPYERLAGASEHALAVRLACLLAARAHGGEAPLAFATGEDVEIAIKIRLEQTGVAPLAAFD